MDLAEFVQTALSQMIKGVRTTQEQTRETGAVVSPPKIWTPDATSQPMVFTAPRDTNNLGRYVSLVEFDVGLTLQEETEGGGKLKLDVACFRADAGATVTASKAEAHRVKFTVPVALPTNDLEKGQQPTQRDK